MFPAGLEALRLIVGPNCFEESGRWRALHRNIAGWEVGVFGRYVNISAANAISKPQCVF